MTSAQEIFLWIDDAQVLWCVPVGALSTCGLYYMAFLAAPTTRPGMISRLLFLIGFLLMLASAAYDIAGWGHNGLGRFGVIFLMAGAVLLIRQIAMACQARRRKMPPHEDLGRRVLASLVEKDR